MLLPMLDEGEFPDFAKWKPSIDVLYRRLPKPLRALLAEYPKVASEILYCAVRGRYMKGG